MSDRLIDINAAWIRSSKCGPPHNCVELNRTDTDVIVRDSKGEEAAILAFGDTPWSAFVRHCRAEF